MTQIVCDCRHVAAHDLANSSNPQLYRLMCNLAERRRGILELVRSALSPKFFGERVRLSGCYYCAVDPRSRQQAFVKGILDKLIEEQEHVAYPAVRAQHDRTFRNWGYVCCFGIVFLAGVDGWLILKLLGAV